MTPLNGWMFALAAGCLTIVGFAPAEIEAQEWIAAGGPSVPQAPMAERRGVGGQVAVAVATEHHRRGFQYRLELTYGRFPTRRAFSARLPDPGEGALGMESSMAYLVYTGAPGPVSLHAGVGVGAYDMNIPGRRDPYGLVPGLGLLLGAKIGTGRVRGLVELQQHAILSDYGNREGEASTYVPLRLGVVVQ